MYTFVIWQNRSKRLRVRGTDNHKSTADDRICDPGYTLFMGEAYPSTGI